MKTIAIAGTFDTKGQELSYIKEKIEAQGVRTLCINTGVFTPSITPDVSNREIAAAAGVDMDEIIARKDRAMATAALAEGMEKLLPRTME